MKSSAVDGKDDPINSCISLPGWLLCGQPALLKTHWYPFEEPFAINSI